MIAVAASVVAFARPVAGPGSGRWAPFPDGQVVDAVEREGALAALLLDDGVLRFVREPDFGEEPVVAGVGDGLAPTLSWLGGWQARYCRDGAAHTAVRGNQGWVEGPAEAEVACLPFERMDGVLTTAAAGLPAGTRVVVVERTPEATATEVRVRAGAEVLVPRSALASATGLQLRADFTGDGVLDTLVRLGGSWPAEDGDFEGFTTRNSLLALDTGAEVRLSEPYLDSCGWTFHKQLRADDATGDGRLDVVAVVEEDVCEAGWLGDHLVVLDGDLHVRTEVVAPAWPLVGRVTAGRMAWWPGGMQLQGVMEEDVPGKPGALLRTETTWRWRGIAPVGTTRSSPATVFVGGREVRLSGLTGGGPVWTRAGEFRPRTKADRLWDQFPIEAVRFVDRELALDAAGGPGLPPRVLRRLDR